MAGPIKHSRGDDNRKLIYDRPPPRPVQTSAGRLIMNAILRTRFCSARIRPSVFRPLQHPRFFSRTQVKCAPPNRPNPRDVYKARNRTLLMYTTATVITAVGATYAAVPLYRAFCSATGFGGIPMTDRDSSRYSADRLVPREEAKRIKVHFNADTATALPWQFQPQQRFVNVLPGETSLAFYKAKNTSKDDIIGIATYNVTPAKVAPYFAKVECFCFEEQKLIAGEEVDMPLLFFIDRDIVDDPLMADVDDVVLSYTFFRARRNSAGHLEPDAPQQVVLESQGWGDIPHAPPKPADSTAT
ncbi:Cytochrome c oxidase assembly protein cox11, mitochondrial [Rhizoctonia solani]